LIIDFKDWTTEGTEDSQSDTEGKK